MGGGANFFREYLVPALFFSPPLGWFSQKRFLSAAGGFC
jgi:hypothetical protein